MKNTVQIDKMFQKTGSEIVPLPVVKLTANEQVYLCNTDQLVAESATDGYFLVSESNIDLLRSLLVFDQLRSNSVVLEVNKNMLRKHHGSSEGRTDQKIMFRCRVAKAGAELSDEPVFNIERRVFELRVLTLSDRAFRGEYADLSGPEIRQLAESFFADKGRPVRISNEIIPDDCKMLEEKLMTVKASAVDVLITTGGTGIGPRDITPDVVKKYLDKEMNGIMDLVRIKYGMKNPNAVLSRSIAGVMQQCLVYVLPGSVKAIREYMTEILPTLDHSLRMLYGIDQH